VSAQVAFLLPLHLEHCCASLLISGKKKNNRKLQLSPSLFLPAFPFSSSCCSNRHASVLKEKQKLSQTAFVDQIVLPWGKSKRTDGRIPEAGDHLEAVCLTDHADLQVKTSSTAPILTRELPKGIKIVGKHNLVLI